ncbi:ACP S-malonyltransferase [Oscillospiraceae bacterium HV4-5-C5C]|nr:ACP S-malonyltransferase [Oscillospiraceae bacterium HV4-5-C5C]
MKTAFIFSGQGAQYPGMGQELAARSKTAAALFDLAGRAGDGSELLSLTREELTDTRKAQLATVAVSLAAFYALQDRLGPDLWQQLETDAAVAGFSLGEYSALGAAGVITAEDLFPLIDARGHAMAEACRQQPGAMAAVLGLDDVRVLMQLSEDEFIDRVFPANYNCPGQLVIAGYEADTMRACEQLKAAGARRCLRLKVAGAFHTPLMNAARPALIRQAERYTYREPEYAVFSNFSGDLLSGVSSLPEYMGQHMCNPVRWTAEVKSLERRGYTDVIEFGPGKVLCGLVQKITDQLETYHVEDTASLEDTAARLQKKLRQD